MEFSSCSRAEKRFTVTTPLARLVLGGGSHYHCNRVALWGRDVFGKHFDLMEGSPHLPV